MTFTLGACAREGGRGVVGILNACIVDFFAFLVGSLGGSMGALFHLGYVETFLVQCPKILWRALMARSCLSHI